MNNEDLQIQIDALKKQIKSIIDNPQLPDHIHNGLDSSRINSQDVSQNLFGNLFGNIIRFLRQSIDAGGTFTNYFSIYPYKDNNTHLSIGTEFTAAGALADTTKVKTIQLISRQDININSRDTLGDGIVNIYAGGTAVNSGGFIGVDNANIDFDITGVASGRIGIRKRNSDLILHFPNLSATPATCTIGDLCVASTKLNICTATNTWTVVGTQT